MLVFVLWLIGFLKYQDGFAEHVAPEDNKLQRFVAHGFFKTCGLNVELHGFLVDKGMNFKIS